MSGITLTVPADRGATWTNTVVEQLDLSLRRLSRALAAPLPTLAVAEERGAVVLAAGDVRLAQSPGIPPATIGRLLGDQVSLIAWPGIVAPALAARGVGETWWLRHAALRGLTIDELAALAAGGADDDTIAWRLADRHPPLVTLRAGTEARATLEDQELRAQAARDAAFWSGLPVPIPASPLHDAALGPGEARLALGALPQPGFAWEAEGGWRSPLARALRHAAPALVDPALALALITDEARIPRRHAAVALARSGVVAIARCIADAAGTISRPVDLAAIIDDAAGIAPGQDAA